MSWLKFSSLGRDKNTCSGHLGIGLGEAVGRIAGPAGALERECWLFSVHFAHRNMPFKRAGTTEGLERGKQTQNT